VIHAAAEAGGVQVVSCPAPLLSVAKLLTLAGEGRAAALEEPGDRALVTLGGSLAPVEAAPSFEGAPAPLLGVLPFDEAERPDTAWRPLAAGGWLLPRLQYERDGERAILRLFGAPGERLEPERELSRLVEAERAPLPPAPRSLGRLTVRRAADYPEAVELAVRTLRERRGEKVVLARRSLALFHGPLSAATVFAQLGARHPGCARYAWLAGGRAFVGATPETLVRVEGRRVTCDALAATREGSFAGGATDKERREHGLVVRALREALAPLCLPLPEAPAPGSRELRGLSHLFTPVAATLRHAPQLVELVRALHPTPAVGGLPRALARELQRALEPEPRGLYAGPFLRREASGDGVAYVMLRGALLDGRAAWLTAGAGLVEGSDGWAELQETEAKLESVFAALRSEA